MEAPQTGFHGIAGVCNVAAAAEAQKESSSAAGEPVSEEEFMKIADNVDDDGLPFN